MIDSLSRKPDVCIHLLHDQLSIRTSVLSGNQRIVFVARVSTALRQGWVPGDKRKRGAYHLLKPWDAKFTVESNNKAFGWQRLINYGHFSK
jgi:hypothetical protein